MCDRGRVCMCCPTVEQLLLNITPAKIRLDRPTEMTQMLWKQLLVGIYRNQINVHTSAVNIQLVIAEQSETLLEYKEIMQFKKVSHILAIHIISANSICFKKRGEGGLVSVMLPSTCSALFCPPQVCQRTALFRHQPSLTL